MALREVATALQGTLGDLRALTSNLQKYESAFSADAKQVFKVGLNCAQQCGSGL